MLARLHAVDYEAVGLGGLGKPEGFLQRQITRWTGQWEKSKDHEIPAIDELARRLERSVPAHTDSSVVHGDYSFNNTMWSNDDPTRMVAILDWEMSTLGDPLTDLGMVAVYWGEAGEMMWRSRRAPAPPAEPGVPRRRPPHRPLRGRQRPLGARHRRLPGARRVQAGDHRGGNLARIRAANPDEDHSGRSQLVDELAALALQIADDSSVASLRGA